MKKTLKHRIYSYLREWHAIEPGKWTHGGEIERLALDAGYKSSNAGRRCRELAEENKIERTLNEKGHVMYRYLPVNDPVYRINQESQKYATNV